MSCVPFDLFPLLPVAGVAGGLTNLSKMPACNIMLLGAQRKTLSGFSSTSVLPHTGYIYHSDIVQSLPPVSAPGMWLPAEPFAGPEAALSRGQCEPKQVASSAPQFPLTRSSEDRVTRGIGTRTP